MISSFHSPAAAAFDRFRLWIRVLCVLVAVCLLLGALKLAARGGCSLPPPVPQDVRRDAICALLGRLPDCRLRVKDTLGARIVSDEINYSVYVGDEFVGMWPIAGGEPIDPTLLTKDLVEYHLRFQTGDAELQTRFRTLFRCRRVAFVDRVLEWRLGETEVLVACVI